MDEHKRKIAPTRFWGRKERKLHKASARAQLKQDLERLSRVPVRSLLEEEKFEATLAYLNDESERLMTENSIEDDYDLWPSEDDYEAR